MVSGFGFRCCILQLPRFCFHAHSPHVFFFFQAHSPHGSSCVATYARASVYVQGVLVRAQTRSHTHKQIRVATHFLCVLCAFLVCTIWTHTYAHDTHTHTHMTHTHTRIIHTCVMHMAGHDQLQVRMLHTKKHTKETQDEHKEHTRNNMNNSMPVIDKHFCTKYTCSKYTFQCETYVCIRDTTPDIRVHTRHTYICPHGRT